MRIAAMGADTDNWRVIGDGVMLCKVKHDLSLNLCFPHAAARSYALGNETPSAVIGRSRYLFSRQVHLPLFGIPGCFEQLHEVA